VVILHASNEGLESNKGGFRRLAQNESKRLLCRNVSNSM